MIGKEDQKKLHLCYYCKEVFKDLARPRYFIWSSEVNKLSAKVAFHKECFLLVAGSDFELEGY